MATTTSLHNLTSSTHYSCIFLNLILVPTKKMIGFLVGDQLEHHKSSWQWMSLRKFQSNTSPSSSDISPKAWESPTLPYIHNSKSAHKSRTYCTIFFGYKRICINISKLFPYCKATHGCSLIFLAWHWKTRNISCLLRFIRRTQGFRRKTGGRKLTKFVRPRCLIFIPDHSHSSPHEGALC